MTSLAVRARVARFLRLRPAKPETVRASPDRDSLDRAWREVQARMKAEVPNAYPTATQAGRAPAEDCQ